MSPFYPLGDPTLSHHLKSYICLRADYSPYNYIAFNIPKVNLINLFKYAKEYILERR